MNTFDDDNERGLFEEPRRRPPRDRAARRPPRSGSRRPGPSATPDGAARLAGLVGFAILVVFGFVLLVGSCGSSSKGDYSAYINAMRPLAQKSASIGKTFAQKLTTPGLTLDQLQTDLTSWSQQETQYYVAAQRLRPPGPLQSAHADAVEVFHLRALSFAGLAGTLKLASDRHDSPSAAGAALASYADLLSASDVNWEQLYKLVATQTLADRNVTAVVVPDSRIVSNPNIVSAHQLALLYQRVRTPAGGGAVGGHYDNTLISVSAVQSGTSTQLSPTTSNTVSASTSSLVIDAVVGNASSTPEVSVPVTITVTVAGQSIYSRTEKLLQIAAHGQATVSFTNVQLKPSAFGHNATITVSVVKVAGEARLDNNSATYPVLFQLSAG